MIGVEVLREVHVTDSGAKGGGDEEGPGEGLILAAGMRILNIVASR